MFGKIGPMELILVLAIVLIIFGPAKLPVIGKSLGDAFGQFKKHANKVSEDLNNDLKDNDEEKKS